MEIDITSLLEMDCFPLSHSRAEGGQNAGPETWAASKAQAAETPLLDTPEKLEAMRSFARESGGWTAEELAEWDAGELNALFLQWIAGDVRECPATLDGVTYEERAGEWFYSTEDAPDMETGPYDSRTEAYNEVSREMHGPGFRADDLSEIDWPEYEVQADAGRISGRMFRGDDGKVYFELGN